MNHHLQWLHLPDEAEKRYTNYGDGRPGDSSELVARINADPSLNLGHTDWRLPTIHEIGLMTFDDAPDKQGASGSDPLSNGRSLRLSLYHVARCGNKYFAGRVRLVRSVR